jgi:hypothetical protein
MTGNRMKDYHKRLIVVLGMHRSGTSAIARSLQVLGVDLGDKLMPPVHGNNDTGFWEDLDINSFNIEMLNSLNTDWYYLTPIQQSDVNILIESGYVQRAIELLEIKIANKELFGFKDPRTAKLLPFWLEVFKQDRFDVNYIISLRHPLSVCQSLSKRDGFDVERSAFLWLEHVLGSLVGTVGKNRVLIDYDRLMQSPQAELEKIAGKFRLHIDPNEFNQFEKEFLSENLRHTIFGINDLEHDGIPRLAREVYANLLNAKDLESSVIRRKLKEWNSEFFEQKNAFMLVDSVTSKAVSLEQTVVKMAENERQLLARNRFLSEKERLLSEKERVLDEILHSRSWRLILHFQRIRLILFPRGGRLERMARSLWRGIRVLRSEGFQAFLYKVLDRLFGKTSWYNQIRNIQRTRLKKNNRAFRHIGGLPPGLLERARKIRDLNVFDSEWYLNDSSTVRETGVDPIEHYLLHGIQEERNPTPLFNTSIYAKSFGIPKEDAFIHFVESGRLYAPGAYRSAEILVTAQKRYQEGLSMKCIREVRNEHQKYAVYFQCGSGSIHERWLGSSSRNWDLIVNHYDQTYVGKIPCNVEFLQTGANPGTKFTSFAMLLSNWRNLIASYEYILLLDDDILISENDINRLFSISSEMSLNCAQASLTPDSFCAHPVVKNAGGSGIRYVNAVEIMMPMLSRNALNLGGHFFSQTISGWGLDMAICKYLGDQQKVAVIDNVIAQHTKSINLEEGAFYKMLRKAYIYPEIELTHLQRIYGFGRSLYEITPG